MNKIEEYIKYLNNLVLITEDTFKTKTEDFKESLVDELVFEFQKEKILTLLTNKDRIEEIAEDHYYAGYKRFSGDICEINNKHILELDKYDENYTMISKLILEHHQSNINKIKFLVDEAQLNPFYSTVDVMAKEIFNLIRKNHEEDFLFVAKEYNIKKIVKEVVEREIIKTTSISKNEIFNYSSRNFIPLHSEISKLSKPTDTIEEINNNQLEFKESLDTSVFDNIYVAKSTGSNQNELDLGVFDLPKTR